MKEERRCLKFMGYIYLPEDEEMTEDQLQRAYEKTVVDPRPGRLQLYDESNKKAGKMIAFHSFSELLKYIELAYRTRAGKIFKKLRAARTQSK